MYAAGGGEDDRATRGECQADQALARDFKIGQAVRCNFYDPARAGEGCRHVKIAVHIEGQSLRSSEALVESAHRAVGLDFVNAVGGAGNK